MKWPTRLRDLGRLRRLSVAALTVIVACTAPPPAPPIPEGMPEGFPAERYRQAADSRLVYEVDPNRTLVTVYAYRDGSLARMGHDHVIASRDVSGYVLLQPHDGATRAVEADLYASLAAMTVDEDALRADAGFTTEPSEKDREGTRGNMLKSLQAAAHPFVRVSIRSDTLPGNRTDIPVNVSLHGMTREVPVPVDVVVGNESVTAAGEFTVRQSDFGIAPFSVLGGALAVRDELDIHFEINARRIGTGMDGTPTGD